MDPGTEEPIDSTVLRSLGPQVHPSAATEGWDASTFIRRAFVFHLNQLPCSGSRLFAEHVASLKLVLSATQDKRPTRPAQWQSLESMVVRDAGCSTTTWSLEIKLAVCVVAYSSMARFAFSHLRVDFGIFSSSSSLLLDTTSDPSVKTSTIL